MCRLDVSVKGSRGMANVALGSVARQLGSLFEGGLAAGLSDGQLLERFTARGDPADEAAFAAIVERHGPMVLGICRRVLGDHHHAEDALQAVFLVLARQARSIRDPDLLGTWLFGVALRTARASRGRIARRRRTEDEGAVRQSTVGAVVAADQAMLKREQSEALHREIDRLPGAFRVPVVLCYFEGLTLDEAAHRLRWPAGTLRSRLARAREKLRRGLTGRGFALSTTALAAALAPPRSASASISPLLCDTTTRAAIHFAAHHAVGKAISASATALAQEMLRSMLIHKLKVVSLTVLFIGAVAAGAGLLTRSLAMDGEPKQTPVTTQARKVITARPDVAVPGRMFVTGRVLDPQGKPVARASIEIVGRPRRPVLDSDEISDRFVYMGHSATDSDGRFQLDAARSSSIGFFAAYALAAAPGFGLGWAELNADAEQPAAEMHLRPEQVIRGRLVDIKGQPAAGAELQLVIAGRPRDDRLPTRSRLGDLDLHDGNYARKTPPACPGRGRLQVRATRAGSQCIRHRSR